MTATSHKSCCFTGYRPEKLPWRSDEEDTRAITLKEKLFDVAEALYRSGITHFIVGMARGCDFYFCEAVLLLREERADITIEAAIPYEEQAADWSEADRNRYFRLVSQCDYETLIQREYSVDCMKKRNYYMVDHAAVLVAVYDGQFGGTMQTVNYARRKGLEIVEVQP
ncbi:MAG: DUF1273 domain-containing protein [Oscillospiraceae bacterium]|nr:DUF1273 domain-containing protein [Oscillospiraceae bacterium]